MIILRACSTAAIALLLAACSIAASAGYVWTTDMSSCVRASRFSPSGGPSDRLVSLQGGESCVIGVAAGEGRLWALGLVNCLAVSNHDTVTGEASAVLTLDGSECASAVAYGAGYLWVTIGLRTVKVSPSTGAVVDEVTPEGIYGVISLAYGGGSLWYLCNSHCLRVIRVDPFSGEILQALILSGSGCASAIAYGDGYLWVAGLTSSRSVSKVDPATGENVAELLFEGELPITSLSYEDSESGPFVVTVAGARACPVGASVALESVSVTAAFPNCVYVESADRAAGIKIVGSPLPTRGSIVGLEGVVEIDSGEKAIRVTAFTEESTSAVRPLGITVRGMSSAPPALSTGGLLVRTWGRVFEVGSDFFGLDEAPGGRSLRVLAGETPIPGLNDRVEATGISAVYLHDGNWLPCLRLRDASDLRVLGSSGTE